MVEKKPKYVEYEDIDITQLNDAPENVRLYPDNKMISRIAETFKHFGLIQPIVVDENNNVIIGSQRLRALRKAGVERVKAIRVDTLRIPLAIKVEGLDNVEKKIISAIENQLRSPLHIDEQKLLIETLIKDYQDRGYKPEVIVKEIQKALPHLDEEQLRIEFPELFPKPEVELVEEEEPTVTLTEKYKQRVEKLMKEGIVFTKPEKIEVKRVPKPEIEEELEEEEFAPPTEFVKVTRVLPITLRYDEETYNEEVLPILNMIGTSGLKEFVRKCIKYYHKVVEFLETLNEAGDTVD